MNNEVYLGVNIDHVANVRQQRHAKYPDPIQAAIIAEESGADNITLHLREDRRHIQQRDVVLLKDIIQTQMNLEMAATEEMLLIAEHICPEHACLVPEKRQELTTEGGLNVVELCDQMKKVCQRLAKVGTQASLFIDPDFDQIEAAHQCGAKIIEIHTGFYADAVDEIKRMKELERIIKAAEFAANLGLVVNAGHGLHYHNVKDIAAIPQINALNIGHSIIARAIFVGIGKAVQEMKVLLLQARGLLV